MEPRENILFLIQHLSPTFLKYCLFNWSCQKQISYSHYSSQKQFGQRLRGLKRRQRTTVVKGLKSRVMEMISEMATPLG
jgi:hypothetical protein